MAKEIDLGIGGIGPAVLLARGGSASVYLAEQTDFARPVAVKVLFNALEDDATFRRFDRECRAIGAVSSHPNIVVVHGRGLTADERPYLIMEHRAGGSLAELLQARGRLTEAEVVRIGIKIGSALQVAHQAGVLHRDVKPANILLSSYNEPALADFGIARIDGGHKTTQGGFSASVLHASREVLNNDDPTPRSDVYGLGSTMFELVTGAAAFADPDDVSMWAVINRVLNSDIPDPRRFGVSDGLAGVLQQAMNHDPQQRHTSAEDLVANLRRLASGNRTAGTLSTDQYPTVRPAEEPGTAATTAIGDTTAPGHNTEATAEVVGEVGGMASPMRSAADGSERPVSGAPTDPPATPEDRGLSPDPQARRTEQRPPGVAAGTEPVADRDDSLESVSRSAVLASVAAIVAITAAVGFVAYRQAAAPIATVETVVRTGQPTSSNPSAVLEGDDITEVTDTAETTSIDEPNRVASTTIELAFPRAELGPLRSSDPYLLGVSGAGDGATFRIVVDGRAVTDQQREVPLYYPEPGRHRVQVQATTDQRVEISNVIDVYVADRGPDPGYRTNLSAIRSDPANWPEALRQFDQMVADGHTELELSLSTREEPGGLPYWNYYVDGFGDDKATALAYCDEFGLGPDACFVAKI